MRKALAASEKRGRKEAGEWARSWLGMVTGLEGGDEKHREAMENLLARSEPPFYPASWAAERTGPFEPRAGRADMLWLPAIPASASLPPGRGLFLRWRGRGLVVDPGRGFLEQFLRTTDWPDEDLPEYRKRLSLACVDGVLLTQPDPAGRADLEVLLTLLTDRNHHERVRSGRVAPHRVDVIANSRAGTAVGSALASLDCVRSVSFFHDEDRPAELDLSAAFGLTLRPVRAVIPGGEVLGTVLTLRGAAGTELRLGLVRTDSWDPDLIDLYQGCHLLLADLAPPGPRDFTAEPPQAGDPFSVAALTALAEALQPSVVVVAADPDLFTFLNGSWQQNRPPLRCLPCNRGWKIGLPGLEVQEES